MDVYQPLQSFVVVIFQMFAPLGGFQISRTCFLLCFDNIALPLEKQNVDE
jgi:hypothetical protein